MSVHAFRYHQYSVEVDRAGQILHLEVTENGALEECPDDPQPTPDGLWDFNTGVHYEAPLYPSLAAAPLRGGFAPFAAFAEKGRIFDQGLVGALEVLAHEGAVGLVGRRALVTSMRDKVQVAPDAAAVLNAAAALTGQILPSQLAARSAAEHVLSDFLDHPTRYKPQGLYSWDDRLEVIHDFDRLLGRPVGGLGASVLAGLIRGSGHLGEAYARHLALSEIIGGRTATCDVFGRGPAGCPVQALFPPRMMPEQHLVEALFEGQPPEHLGDAIDRHGFRRGLEAPSPFSGIVRQQMHAWAALLGPTAAPEAPSLHFGQRYKRALREAFKGWTGVTGQPVIKVLEAYGARDTTPRQHTVALGPNLTVEPMAEAYRRRALGYRDLRRTLVELLGRPALEQAVRIRQRGPVDNDLHNELVEMELLFLGAYLISCDEVGHPAEANGYTAFEREAAVARTRSWLRRWRQDADLAMDLRMMIPVGRDPERGTVRVHAVVGVTTRDLQVRFVREPKVRVRADVPGSGSDPEVTWVTQTVPIATLSVITCDVHEVLDDRRFRALCEREVTMARVAYALASH